MVLRTVTALGVLRVYAPPALIFPQSLHPQIPTAFLFTANLPQNSQKNLECWLTSIFLICFLKLAPYLVPYFPTIPAFFVRFVISADKIESRGFPCPSNHHNRPSALKDLYSAAALHYNEWICMEALQDLNRVPSNPSSNGIASQGGQYPVRGKATLVFKANPITVDANHGWYRGSLRSSSKWVPSNPSSNGVLDRFFLGEPWSSSPGSHPRKRAGKKSRPLSSRAHSP